MISQFDVDEMAGVIGHAWASALATEGLAMSIRERDVVDDAMGVVVAAFADLFEDGPAAFDRDAFVRAASSAATRAEKRGPAHEWITAVADLSQLVCDHAIGADR